MLPFPPLIILGKQASGLRKLICLTFVPNWYNIQPLMQGICILCGGKTSLRKIERCKKCYLRESKKAYEQKCAERDNQILLQISSCQKTAAEIAKQYNLSREGIRLILAKNGLNYRAIKRKISKIRREEKESEKQKQDIRLCLMCKKTYTRGEKCTRFKYCSEECHMERFSEMQRQRSREYYIKQRMSSPKFALLGV